MMVLVVGAGVMGHGIAEVCAIAGYEVILVDVEEDILKAAVNRIRWSLEKLERKGRVRAAEVLSKIKTMVDLEAAAREADFVIEAVVEKTEVKKEVFERLDAHCRDDVVFASNTSTIPITELAKATKREDKVVGLHFFNPPTLIRLVEIVRGDKTSDATVKRAIEFAKSIGMDYVLVEKDVPGFLVNRINVRVLAEAVRMLDEHSVEEIDAAVRYRLGFPMGIFEVLDFSGIDTAYNVMVEMKKRGFEIEVPKLLEEMVKEGRLGMKTGRGFYEYSGFYGRAAVSKKLAYNVRPLRLLAPGVNEAAWILRNGVASREDIDKAMVKGMGYPKGILQLADTYGIDRIVDVLMTRKGKSGLTEYEPDEMLKEMVKEGKLGMKSGEGFYSWRYEKVNFGVVEYEKRHSYALITMRRADKLNALNEEMWSGLRRAFERALNDADVRVVLITGEGRAFCAGDDIAVMGSWRSFADGVEFFDKIAMPLIKLLADYDKPIVSLVNGIAFGGGMELNLLFDVVIASDRARFAVPEALIGAMPPIASSLGYAVLGRRLAYYALTGEEMDAEEAKQLGLVDLVVPHEQLEEVGIEIAEKISRVAPLSARGIKRAINAVRMVFSAASELAGRELELLIPTEDFAEGMRAFAERRRPEWRGR